MTTEIYTSYSKMRELIHDNNQLLPVISRFNIAFGFGDRTVDEVCRTNGVDSDTFLSVCNFLSGYPCDVERISLSHLTAYLKHAHASFLDITFPSIRRSIIEAISPTCDNEVAVMLIKFFDNYVGEVRKHMCYENDTVFGYVDALLSDSADDTFSIKQFSVNHGHMATKLNQLKDIFIYHYKQNNNDRLSMVLFDIIRCEHDLMAHFQVETHLLVPAVERIEQRKCRKDSPDEAAARMENPDTSDIPLSEREKEIVKYVSYGLANKEIADRLFISAHTVATHRRNISAKLNIHSASGLTIYAIIHKLVKLEEVSLQ